VSLFFYDAKLELANKTVEPCEVVFRAVIESDNEGVGTLNSRKRVNERDREAL
jgi:hypothetical protein